MKVSYFSLSLYFFVISFLCSCQHYAVRSNSSGNVNELRNANYKIVSIKEGEGDPYNNKIHNRMDDGTEYRNVDDARRVVIESAFQKEIEKVFGNNVGSGGDLAVEIKINRRVLCSRDMFAFTGGAGYRGGVTNNYSQTGNILLELKGKNKGGTEVFNVVVDYDMTSNLSGSVRAMVCDSFEKISKIINDKVLPLAVKEIGQNRVIDKL